MSLQTEDRAMIAGIVASLVVWWIYTGRKRYGLKGRSYP